MDRTNNTRRTFLICVLLGAVTIAVYWPVTGHDFVNFDDPAYVTANPHVQGGLTWENLGWALTTLHYGIWHPLTWVSHMLDCQCFGLRPGGHHLTSLLLHAANTVLLFVILRRMTGARWRSALVAALFALHPLHVESVAWVCERKDVLSTFFVMLTLWAYARYAEGRRQNAECRMQNAETSTTQHATGTTPHSAALSSTFDVQRSKFDAPPSPPRSAVPSSTFDVQRSKFDVPPSPPRSAVPSSTFKVQRSKFDVPPSPASSIFYLLSVLFFVGGLMSKPMVVTLPLILLLLDYWPLKRIELAALVSRPSLPARLIMEKLPFVLAALLTGLITLHAANGVGSLPSAAQYPMTDRIANATLSYAGYFWQVFWPANLAVYYLLPATFSVWSVGGAALVLLGISVTAVCLARRWPYVVVGWLWYLATLLPVIGLIQLASYSHADRYTYVPLIGLFVSLVWGAGELVSHWRRPALACAAAAVAVAMLLGLALTRQQVGYWKDSETLLRHAVEVTENNYIAHLVLGNALDDKGQTDAAMTQYREAIRLKPDFAMAHHNLGYALDKKGQIDEAISQYQEAIRLNPNYAPAHFNLGIALGKKGELDAAISQYQEALRLKPDYADAQHNLGYVLLKKGRTGGAILCFERVLTIQPTNTVMLNNLAWIRAANPEAEFRDGAEAVRLAEKACRLTGYKEAVIVGTLAAAYAEAGRFEEAVATAEKAREQARADGQQKVAEKNQEMIQLYKARQPYREPAGEPDIPAIVR